MKKILCVLFAIVQIVLLVSVPAFADTDEPVESAEFEFIVDDENQNDFSDGFNIFDTVGGIIEYFAFKYVIEPVLALPTFFIMSVLAVFTTIIMAFE